MFLHWPRHQHLYQPGIILENSKKKTVRSFPAGNNMFKVNDGNIRTRCGICSKLTIKTPERRNWRRSGVFIINFGTYFTPCSSVSIVNFEQVNTGWVVFSALGIFGSSICRGSANYMFLKMLQSSQESTYVGGFFDNIVGCRAATLLKKNSA